MSTDELNDSLRTLIDVLNTNNLRPSLRACFELAAEEIANQLRYRATGSVLAAKEPA